MRRFSKAGALVLEIRGWAGGSNLIYAPLPVTFRLSDRPLPPIVLRGTWTLQSKRNIHSILLLAFAL
jgi:hypothetical protein